MIFRLLEKTDRNHSGQARTWIFDIKKSGRVMVATISIDALAETNRLTSTIRNGKELYEWIRLSWVKCAGKEDELGRQEWAEVAQRLIHFNNKAAFEFVAEKVSSDVRAALAADQPQSKISRETHSLEIAAALPHFGAGCFAAIVGVSSVEAGWLFDFPQIKTFKEWKRAERYFNRKKAEAQKAFQIDIARSAFGVIGGHLTPSDPQIFSAWIIKKPDDGHGTVSGGEIIWHPDKNGFGYFEKADFNPETIYLIADHLGEA